MTLSNSHSHPSLKIRIHIERQHIVHGSFSAHGPQRITWSSDLRPEDCGPHTQAWPLNTSIWWLQTCFSKITESQSSSIFTYFGEWHHHATSSFSPAHYVHSVSLSYHIRSSPSTVSLITAEPFPLLSHSCPRPQSGLQRALRGQHLRSHQWFLYTAVQWFISWHGTLLPSYNIFPYFLLLLVY